MSERKRKKKQSRKRLIVILTVLLVIIAAVIIGILSGKVSGKNGEKNPADTGKTDSEQGIPEELKSTEIFDDGNLKLVGSMEYEGPNFENGSMEEGKYTVLEIQNISGKFLRKAEIEVKVNDSETMKLTLDSIPADTVAMVIGQGDVVYSENAVYQVVSCESSYEESVADQKDGLDVVCEAEKIRITNQLSETVENVVFRYKGKIGEMLWGGVTYEFAVESLGAGETFETASQCFLAETVQIVEVK